jgi:hypothetical protein
MERFTGFAGMATRGCPELIKAPDCFGPQPIRGVTQHVSCFPARKAPPGCSKRRLGHARCRRLLAHVHYHRFSSEKTSARLHCGWQPATERDKENERGKGRTPDQHYPTLTYDTGMGLVFRNRHELLLYGTRGP